MVSWKELIASFRQQRIVQEASGQQRILLLLFILGQENFNSTYQHETAKSLKTLRAYNIKLALRDFWNQDPHSAESYLKRWYFWATHSRLDAVIDCAKTIKQHWNGIINYTKTKISNGILEGTNSIIQAAKDSARGFRSTKNFIITIYLRMGKLEFNLPT